MQTDGRLHTQKVKNLETKEVNTIIEPRRGFYNKIKKMILLSRFHNRIKKMILLSRFYNRIKKMILLSRFYYKKFIMRKEMLAIINKDLRQVATNKRMFLPLLLVPIVLTVLMPSIFVFAIHFIPDKTSEFERLIELLPAAEYSESLEQTVANLLLNYLLPVFFLIIPIMAASIMAASSFVGEKEKRTLETLLYCPLSLKQIFRSKVLASFLLSMMVSLLSFCIMLLVLESEIFALSGRLTAPSLNWLLVLLLVSPAISMIAITLIVRLSAKAQSMEDAQQAAVFLILPLLLLVAGQFTGILLISFWILLGIGILCGLLAWLLMKKAMGNFNYELLL